MNADRGAGVRIHLGADLRHFLHVYIFRRDRDLSISFAGSAFRVASAARARGQKASSLGVAHSLISEVSTVYLIDHGAIAWA